ncbi:MAG: glycoside hydrolase family 125 protein [Bacteroidota bacterium]|nr:glycoside hydrolase family 125 protein [Bacteroidota bacterium]
MERRTFIKSTAIVSVGMHFLNDANATINVPEFISQRPELVKRTFVSQAVENQLISIKKLIKDPELAWMFENCYPNTLDTTVRFNQDGGKPDTFIITGDINAMWLRDSTAQVWPYLPLVNKDEKLKTLFKGLINRQSKCVNIDPYANAFNFSANEVDKGWQSDETDMKPELHERKWEIDSLCYVVRLAHGYWKTTKDTSVFDADWEKAMKTIVKTFKEQQRKENLGPYKFKRNGNNPTDTAGFDGYGNKVKPIGLICSIFRPSDDSTIFPFLIPSNLFAVQALRQLAEIFTELKKDNNFVLECNALANEVETAVKKYAIINHAVFGQIYAYEIDGFGSSLVMDDANVPSLLSLPYLNSIKRDDPLYVNTRNYALSEYNPWFFKGKAAEGIGGPHTGRDTIWPMGIIMRAITSTSDDEIKKCLKMLKETHNKTGFIHESFYMNDAQYFSRKWFAWANTLFGEMIIKIATERPHLL